MIRKLIRVVGEPRTTDPESFFGDLADIVGKWSDEVYERAAVIALRDHVYPGWPPAGALRKACERANKEINDAKPRVAASDPDDERPPQTDEQIARQQEAYAAFKRAVAHVDVTPHDVPKAKIMQRDEFEAMQRNSPNKHLHLTDRSLRMMGDRRDDGAAE